MTQFIKKNLNYYVADSLQLTVSDGLPLGTYIVRFDPEMSNFCLVPSEPFANLPAKIYGGTTKDADRIMSTFEDRTLSTGVLLLGEKGSGKTMLAKLLSQRATALGIPTLIVNSQFSGVAFNQFLQKIDQRCVVIFDEFEKVYDEEHQEEMLTLLDGVFPQKKLFVLTCNNRRRIDEHMMNRPGRIYYFIQYEGLDIDFIREYAEDNIKNKAEIQKFTDVVTTLFTSMNFDMMKAIVEEMNRYDEGILDAIRILNTKPTQFGVGYNVRVFRIADEQEVTGHTTFVEGDVFQEDYCFDIYYSDADNEKCHGASKNTELYRKFMVDMSAGGKVVTYEAEGHRFILTRENPRKKGFGYFNAF